MMDKETEHLTGIRGIAVSLVLIAHLFSSQYFAKSIAYLGMSMFFMLSGLVLTIRWAETFFITRTNFFNFRKTFFSFIWARFSRLAPLYLLAAIPYFAISGRSPDLLLSLIPRYFFAMQSWFYDYGNAGTTQLLVYPLSWSISSELFLYLVFPFLILSFYQQKHSNRLSILNIFLFFYVSFIIFITAKGIYTGEGYPPSQTKFDWFVYLSPYGRLLEFCFGITIGFHFLEKKHDPRKASFNGLFALSLLVLIVILLSLYQSHHEHINSTLALLRMSPLLTLPLMWLMVSMNNGKDICKKLFSNSILIWENGVIQFICWVG